MKTYLVGGAVRDALMDRPVKDRDWCVVGSSPQEMLDAGFLPVGKDFPVFLHPQTKEEYALARTERKTAPGYHGFEFHAAADVTIEQDLARRDLTINSIALCADSMPANGIFDIKKLPKNAVIDPFEGQKDIQEKLLRHTSYAFEEDPVRILRVARFAARYVGFSVAKPTMDLMRRMVAAGEVEALVAERVWQEISKGLMEDKPSRMFQVLRQCGALQVLLPEVERLWGVPQRAEYHPEIDTGVHLMMVLDMAAQLNAPLPVRFACLVHDLGKGSTPQDVLPRHIGHEIRSVDLLLPVCERLRVPTECKELAVVVAKEHGNIHRSDELDAKATLRLLERCDAIRKPQRFAQVLQACECDARGRLGLQEQTYLPAQRLAWALELVLAVPTADIAADALERGMRAEQIGQAIASARVRVLSENLKER
ncbi:multifunctional CCA addition/repair protein [Variovorax sp. PCZ-1]|uniref:multifunctional CCA addition/repair protein n=1 Tax=Variovorax sp. PCZ-1 TaxID=2835533 RepID=UPI001BCBFE3B|nr:multifunctional CCA addition/repair protein [Variovorax sp. PCZ-1]MBS7806250.1 multifunctional CCA addition/repair protein [Variovorax sp. PCZ-1]